MLCRVVAPPRVNLACQIGSKGLGLVRGACCRGGHQRGLVLPGALRAMCEEQVLLPDMANDDSRQALELHPLILEEAILHHIVTAMSLEARLALYAAIWEPSALAPPENMEVLRAATTRAAIIAQEALERGNSVARPSTEELLHLLTSEVQEVRLVGVTSLRQMLPSES